MADISDKEQCTRIAAIAQERWLDITDQLAMLPAVPDAQRTRTLRRQCERAYFALTEQLRSNVSLAEADEGLQTFFMSAQAFEGMLRAIWGEECVLDARLLDKIKRTIDMLGEIAADKKVVHDPASVERARTLRGEIQGCTIQVEFFNNRPRDDKERIAKQQGLGALLAEAERMWRQWRQHLEREMPFDPKTEAGWDSMASGRIPFGPRKDGGGTGSGGRKR